MNKAPGKPMDPARYYRMLGVIADAFKTRSNALQEIRHEPDEAIRRQLIGRLKGCVRQPWRKGEFAPDTPSFTSLKPYPAGIGGEGGHGSVSILQTNEGKTLAAKSPLGRSGDRSLWVEYEVQRCIVQRMKRRWHPNLARLYGLWRPPGASSEMLLMEHIRGRNGRAVINCMAAAFDNGLLGVEECLGAVQFIAHRLASVSTFLGEAGFAHNDFDWTNLMIEETGEVVVIDFGAATRIGQKVPAASKRYAAPEIVPLTPKKLRPSNPASDAYSIGRLVEEVVRKDGSVQTVFALDKFVDSLKAQDPARRPKGVGLQMLDFVADRGTDDAKARETLRKVLDLLS